MLPRERLLVRITWRWCLLWLPSLYVMYHHLFYACPSLTSIEIVVRRSTTGLQGPQRRLHSNGGGTRCIKHLLPRARAASSHHGYGPTFYLQFQVFPPLYSIFSWRLSHALWRQPVTLPKFTTSVIKELKLGSLFGCDNVIDCE